MVPDPNVIRDQQLVAYLHSDLQDVDLIAEDDSIEDTTWRSTNLPSVECTQLGHRNVFSIKVRDDLYISTTDIIISALKDVRRRQQCCGNICYQEVDIKTHSKRIVSSEEF